MLGSRKSGKRWLFLIGDGRSEGPFFQLNCYGKNSSKKKFQDQIEEGFSWNIKFKRLGWGC